MEFNEYGHADDLVTRKQLSEWQMLTEQLARRNGLERRPKTDDNEIRHLRASVHTTGLEKRGSVQRDMLALARLLVRHPDEEVAVLPQDARGTRVVLVNHMEHRDGAQQEQKAMAIVDCQELPRPSLGESMGNYLMRCPGDAVSFSQHAANMMYLIKETVPAQHPVYKPQAGNRKAARSRLLRYTLLSSVDKICSVLSLGTGPGGREIVRYITLPDRIIAIRNRHNVSLKLPSRKRAKLSALKATVDAHRGHISARNGMLFGDAPSDVHGLVAQLMEVVMDSMTKLSSAAKFITAQQAKEPLSRRNAARRLDEAISRAEGSMNALYELWTDHREIVIDHFAWLARLFDLKAQRRQPEDGYRKRDAALIDAAGDMNGWTGLAVTYFDLVLAHVSAIKGFTQRRSKGSAEEQVYRDSIILACNAMAVERLCPIGNLHVNLMGLYCLGRAKRHGLLRSSPSAEDSTTGPVLPHSKVVRFFTKWYLSDWAKTRSLATSSPCGPESLCLADRLNSTRDRQLCRSWTPTDDWARCEMPCWIPREAAQVMLDAARQDLAERKGRAVNLVQLTIFPPPQHTWQRQHLQLQQALLTTHSQYTSKESTSSRRMRPELSAPRTPTRAEVVEGLRAPPPVLPRRPAIAAVPGVVN